MFEQSQALFNQVRKKMSADAKKAVGHAGIYALGNISRNAVSFIMLPIYTSYLTPADYGVIELLSMLIDFVSIVLGMRLGEAIFRFYCNTSDELEKNSVISTSLYIAAALNSVGVVVVVLLSKPLATLVFGDVSFARYLTLFSLTLLVQAFIEVPMIYLRARQKPWHFVGFSLFKLALQLSLNIYLIVFKGFRVEGVIYSALASGVIMAVILTSFTLFSVGLRFSRSIMKHLIRFSVPLMLAGVGAFYLTFGDRYFLRAFGDLADVGIYALGYKFGFLLTVLIWDPFEKIWATQRYEVHKRADAQNIFQRTFVLMSVLLISAALGISLFVKDLLGIMADPAFHDAYKVVPVVLAAYIMQSWTNYCYFSLLLKKSTIQIAYGTALAVAVITIAYATLIPRFGIYGAAWATVFGFGARLYWINAQGRRQYDMALPWSKVWLLGGLAMGIYFAAWFAPDQFGPSVAVRVGLFAAYIVIFLRLPILSSAEKKAVFLILRDPRRIKEAFA